MRSCTEIVMIVKMPTPPTTSDILPSAATAEVIVLRITRMVLSIWSWVVIEKSSEPCRAISRRVMSPSTSLAGRFSA